MPTAKDMVVLVVDDQQSMRQLTRYSLEQLGIRKVTEAADGKDAVSAMQSQKFDLIISDWNMDVMDGLELLKHVRADPLFNKTPFIMATGQNSKAQVKEAIDAGVNNYMVKPINGITLKKKIESVMGPLQ